MRDRNTYGSEWSKGFACGGPQVYVWDGSDQISQNEDTE